MLKVQVVTLTRGSLRAELAYFREYLAARERRYQLNLAFSDAQPIAQNRNLIAQNFLKLDYDYLLTIDDDTVPTFNPLDYVEADKDIIGFPYPTWRGNDPFPIKWFPAEPDGRGLIEVEKVGGGCLLIARRVLAQPAMAGPFLDWWGENGLKIESEDISFCLRAKAAGFKIWCAMDKPCAHFKTAELLTLWRAINGQITTGVPEIGN